MIEKRLDINGHNESLSVITDILRIPTYPVTMLLHIRKWNGIDCSMLDLED